MAYSLQQMIGFAKQAGFTGTGLAQIVAIAMAESQGVAGQQNPNGEDSRGLTQINVAPNANPTYANRNLYDPVENFRAAFALSGGGKSFGIWTTFSGKTDAGRKANAYQYMGQTYQLAGLDPATAPKAPWGGGTAMSTTTAAAGTAAAPAEKYRLPSDTTIYVVDNGVMFAVYDVGGSKLRFDVSTTTTDISGVRVQHISGAAFHALGTVASGDSSELAPIAKDYGTFGSFFNSLLDRLLPPHSGASNDPSVRAVVAQVAGNPGLLSSPTEIQRLMSRTTWYQGQSDQALKFNQATQAEQKQMVAEEAVRIAGTFQEKTGEVIGPNDPRIMQWADLVARGTKGEGQILYEEIIPRARQNPESPLSRDERDEQEKQLQRPNEIESKSAEVVDMFHKWGIPSTKALADQWAMDLANGTKSDGDLSTYLQNTSKVLYPWKDPTVATEDAASPWMQTYERLMEVPAKDGLFNPEVQKALNAGTPLWQFEEQLKKTPEWLKTNNARDTMTDAFTSAGKLMGFA